MRGRKLHYLCIFLRAAVSSAAASAARTIPAVPCPACMPALRRLASRPGSSSSLPQVKSIEIPSSTGGSGRCSSKGDGAQQGSGPASSYSPATSASAPRRATGRATCVVCPYHGWAIDGEGKLREVPANTGAEALPSRPVLQARMEWEREQNSCGCSACPALFCPYCSASHFVSCSLIVASDLASRLSHFYPPFLCPRVSGVLSASAAGVRG